MLILSSAPSWNVRIDSPQLSGCEEPSTKLYLRWASASKLVYWCFWDICKLRERVIDDLFDVKSLRPNSGKAVMWLLWTAIWIIEQINPTFLHVYEGNLTSRRLVDPSNQMFEVCLQIFHPVWSLLLRLVSQEGSALLTSIAILVCTLSSSGRRDTYFCHACFSNRL